MPAYDANQFVPPAPLVRVILRNPENDATRADVVMLLDSGADVTILPQEAVSVLQVEAIPERRYQ